MNAQDWLAYSCAQEYVPNEDAARIRCRYTDEIEVYCGIIASVIGGVSPNQILTAGISYSNGERISELDELIRLKRNVIDGMDWYAMQYVIQDSLRKKLFDGDTKLVRVERSLRDKVAGLSIGTGVNAPDIFLMRWWVWFFEILDLDSDLDVLKANRRVELASTRFEHIKLDLQEKIAFIEKFSK